MLGKVIQGGIGNMTNVEVFTQNSIRINAETGKIYIDPF